jgi:hypothetical protein
MTDGAALCARNTPGRFRLRVGLVLTVTIGALGAALGVAAGETTFTRDVVPILQAHCQECHRRGGAAPFELAVYDHVYQRRDKIAKVVAARAMPPWKPVAGYGDFHGVRGLSKDEVATIRRWVDGGAPEGDPRDRPPPRTFDAADARGTPALVIRTDRFTVKARSGDVYRCFSIPTAFAEERFFTLSEVVPGNSRIVHHMLAMVDEAGDSARIPSGDADPGYPCFGGPKVRIGGYLGGWTPGSRPWAMPEGVGIRLPPGARVVVQMHYHNARLTPETDRSELRLYAATAPVTKHLQFMRVGQFSLTIPAGAARHEIEGAAFVYRPMSLIAIHPHMHLLGREMKVWARLADGSRRPLIHIDDWDFHWQGFYFYRTPVALPVGAWIEMMAAWDNSADNPRNPNQPPKRVYWGERTVDEMGHAAVLFTFDDETPSR